MKVLSLRRNVKNVLLMSLIQIYPIQIGLMCDIRFIMFVLLLHKGSVKSRKVGDGEQHNWGI